MFKNTSVPVEQTFTILFYLLTIDKLFAIYNLLTTQPMKFLKSAIRNKIKAMS